MRFLLKTLFSFFILGLTLIIGIAIGSYFLGDKSLSGKDKVAVIYVDDVIIQSRQYLDSIKKIKKNDSVKAVLVRINSPGGAVGPSQEIYSELESLGEELPVVASLGNVAASGGYYIALAADTVYANPGTITGSIGVIAQFANFKQLLEWARVDVEVVKSGDFKDLGSPLKDMSEDEKKYINSIIQNVHAQFKDVVSEKRGISDEKLAVISDGRIFTGQQAKENKLIDELGTFNTALRKAAELGGIEGEPETLEYPKQQSPFFNLLFSKTGTHSKLLSNPVKTSFGLYYIANVGY